MNKKSIAAQVQDVKSNYGVVINSLNSPISPNNSEDEIDHAKQQQQDVQKDNHPDRPWDDPSLTDEAVTEAAKQFEEEYSSTQKLAVCEKKTSLSMPVLKDYLKIHKISVKYNMVKHDMEIVGIGKGYSEENHINTGVVDIKEALKAYNYVCDRAYLLSLLTNIADLNRYSPVIEMMEKKPWSGEDRFQRLFEIMGISDEEFEFERTLVTKWLWQAVSIAYNDEDEPYGAEGVLVLQGEEGVGKSSFFEKLAISKKWFKSAVSLSNVEDPDVKRQATSCWIAELGEIDGTLRSKQPTLKGFITQEVDEYRRAYAQADSNPVRRTVFCGTVNPDEFIEEESGTRRWWIVNSDRFNSDALRELPREWVEDLWHQVKTTMYDHDPQGFRLTPQERRILQQRNRKFKKPLKFEGDIIQCLDFSIPESEYIDVKAIDLKSHAIISAPANAIGQALKRVCDRYGFKYEVDRNDVTHYHLPLKPWKSLSTK